MQLFILSCVKVPAGKQQFAILLVPSKRDLGLRNTRGYGEGLSICNERQVLKEFKEIFLFDMIDFVPDVKYIQTIKLLMNSIDTG